jgi:hypothetical protein
LIRANLAETPETSPFTSAFDRIQARWKSVSDELNSSTSLPQDDSDSWLAPISLDEDAHENMAEETPWPSNDEPGRTPICNPIGAARISNKGFLPMTLAQYLSLLDTLGRIIRKGKRGFIPPSLAPILERLNVEPQSWLDSLLDLLKPAPPPLPS